MLIPSPPSLLPRIREDLSRRREALRGAGKRIRGSRRSYRVDARKSLPPRSKNTSPGSSLPQPRKLFRGSVNSFRAPRVLSLAQDISSRRRELNSRRREFLRSHRNSLRSAPKELPNPSSLFLGTVYQYGKLHPSLGNIVKEFIDTGIRPRRRETLPSAASSFTDFLHLLGGLRAYSRRWDRPFRALEEAPSRSVFRRGDACSLPDARRSLPAYPNSFSSLRARTQERRDGSEAKGSRSQGLVLPPMPSVFLRWHGHFGRRAANELADTRRFWGGLCSGSGEGELTRGTGCSVRGCVKRFTRPRFCAEGYVVRGTCTGNLIQVDKSAPRTPSRAS